MYCSATVTSITDRLYYDANSQSYWPQKRWSSDPGTAKPWQLLVCLTTQFPGVTRGRRDESTIQNCRRRILCVTVRINDNNTSNLTIHRAHSLKISNALNENILSIYHQHSSSRPIVYSKSVLHHQWACAHCHSKNSTVVWWHSADWQRHESRQQRGLLWPWRWSMFCQPPNQPTASKLLTVQQQLEGARESEFLQNSDLGHASFSKTF